MLKLNEDYFVHNKKRKRPVFYYCNPLYNKMLVYFSLIFLIINIIMKCPFVKGNMSGFLNYLEGSFRLIREFGFASRFATSIQQASKREIC